MADKEYNGYIKSVRDSNGNVYATHDPRVDDKDFLKKDWNENDKVSTAYIENRTHYEETKNRFELVKSSYPYFENDKEAGGTFNYYYKVSDIPFAESEENLNLDFYKNFDFLSWQAVKYTDYDTSTKTFTIETGTIDELWSDKGNIFKSGSTCSNNNCYKINIGFRDNSLSHSIDLAFVDVLVDIDKVTIDSDKELDLEKGIYVVLPKASFDPEDYKYYKYYGGFIGPQDISIKQLDKKYIQDVYDKFDSSIQNLEKTKMNIANPKGTGNFTITDGYAIFQNGAYEGTNVNPDDDGNKFITKSKVKEQVDKAVTLTDDQTIEGKKYFEDGLYSGQIKDTNNNYIEIKTYIDNGDDKAVKLKSNEVQTITGQVIFEKGLYSDKIKDKDNNYIEIKTYIDGGDNKAVNITGDQTIKGKKYFEDGLYSGKIKDKDGNYIEIKTYIDDEIKLKENQLTELQNKIDSLTNAYADTRDRVDSFITFAEGHEF